MIEKNGLIDAWDELYPNKNGYTWKNKSRLDRILISFNNINEVIKVELKNLSYTDHSMLLISLGVNEKQIPVLWKLKQNVLNMSEIENELADIINEYKEKPQEIVLKWNECKAKIISMFAEKERKLNKKYAEKRNNLKNLKNIITETEAFDMENLMNDNIRNELKYMSSYDYKIKTSVFLSNKEKWKLIQKPKQREKDEINQIRTKQGQITNDKEEISMEFYKYYEELYNKRKENDQYDLKLYEKMKEITREEIDFECEITEKEIEEVIKSLEMNKTPGMDGLRSELYLRYNHIMTPILKVLYNEIYKNNRLPENFNKGYIRLIPKKNEVSNIHDYRPLTLLNNDFKIYTKILSQRVLRILESRINKNQTYTMRNRTMLDNLKIINAVIWDINKKKTNSFMLTLDIEKAFDSVQYDHLYIAIRTLGIPKKYAIAIMVTLTNGYSCLKLNGKLTEFFLLKNGLRQGDPLSAVLFVIALEPLLQKIGKELKDHIFEIKKVDVTTLAYADDIVCFSKKIGDIVKIIEIFSRYKCQTGLKLNLQKTYYIHFNSHIKEEENKENNTGIKEVHKVKILGITYGKKGVSKKNNEDLVKDINSCKSWIKRNKYTMSFDDRINFINGKILPKILFLSNVYKFKAIEIRKYQSIIDNIFWMYGKHWIKKSIVYAEKRKGGYRVPNLKLKIAVQRIKRLLDIMFKEEQNNSIQIDRGLFELQEQGRNILTIYQDYRIWKKSNLPPILNEMYKYEKMLKINLKFKGEINQILKTPLKYNCLISTIYEEFDMMMANPNIYYVGEFIEQIQYNKYKKNYQRKLMEKLIEICTLSKDKITDWRNYDHRHDMQKVTLINKENIEVTRINDLSSANIYKHLLEHYVPGNDLWTRMDNEIHEKKYPKKIVDYNWRFMNGAFLTPKIDKKINKIELWKCPICGEKTEEDYHIIVECENLGRINEDILKIKNLAENKMLNFLEKKKLNKDQEEKYKQNVIYKLDLTKLARMIIQYARYRIYGKVKMKKEFDIENRFKYYKYLMITFIDIYQERTDEK